MFVKYAFKVSYIYKCSEYTIGRKIHIRSYFFVNAKKLEISFFYRGTMLCQLHNLESRSTIVPNAENLTESQSKSKLESSLNNLFYYTIITSWV